MNFIESQIREAFKRNKMICVCLHKIDWNSRVIGHVKNILGLTKFKIEVIDEFGQKKTVRTIPFTSVRSLEIGGVYNENLEILNSNGFSKNNSIPKYYSKGKHDLLKHLSRLKEAKTLCTFFFDTEYSTGMISEVTEQELAILNIGYDGKEDGISIFDVTLLTKIRYGTNFENRISFLANIQGQRNF